MIFYNKLLHTKRAYLASLKLKINSDCRHEEAPLMFWKGDIYNKKIPYKTVPLGSFHVSVFNQHSQVLSCYRIFAAQRSHGVKKPPTIYFLNYQKMFDSPP